MSGAMLYGMDPGLIRIDYSFKDNDQKELALILDPSLGMCLQLPNNALCYRPFLRESMKAAFPKGMRPIGPFSGHELRDKHIIDIKGRIIKLNKSFCNFEENYNHLLIPCNTKFFRATIGEMDKALKGAGFDPNTYTWEDYKAWEVGKMETFKN